MPILVTCSNGHKLRVKDELAGKKVRCPKCKAVVQIPASEAAEESDELSVLMESDPGTAPPLPPASPRRPAPSKARPAPSKARGARRGAPRRAKSDGSPMKLVLAIGGAAAALGILVVVGVFVLGIGGGGGGDDDGIPGGIVDDRTAEQKANDQPPTQSTQQPGQQTQRQTPPAQAGQASRNRGQTQTAPGAVAAAELPAAPEVPYRALDLSYVPEQAEVIISLRPAELAASPLIAQLLATPQARKSLAEMEQQLGLSVSDIESLVIALPSLNDASSAAMAQAGGMGGAFSFGTASGAARAGGLPGTPGAPGVAPGQPSAAAVPPTIYVARTTKPFDPQKLLAQAEDSQPQQVDGTTYFRVRMPATATGGVPPTGALGGPNRGNQGPGQPPSGGNSPPGGPGGASAQKQSEPVAVFFPDNQTAVFGTEELVQAAIGQGSSQAQRPELASFNAGHHVLIAIAPQGGLGAAARAAPLAGNDPLLQALTQHGTALSLSFMVADNVFAYATVQCNDEQGAAQVLAAVNNSIQQLNTVAGGMKQNLPAPVTQIIDQVLGSLTAKQGETTVTVTAAIPAAAFNPQIWLSLMLSGRMGPGGNPLGAPQQGNPQGPAGAPPGAGASSGGLSKQEETPVAAKVLEEGWEKTLRLSYEKPRDFLVRTKGEALFATIDLTGAAAQGATAYGMMRVDSAKDDRGNELKPLEPLQRTGLQGDPFKQFVAANTSAMLRGKPNRPDNRVRIHLMLDSPFPAANQLAALEGSVQLAQYKEIILRGNLNRSGTKFADPALEESGLSVQIGRDLKVANVDPAMIVVVQVTGPSAKLLAIMLADESGRSLSAGVGRSESGGMTTYTLLAQDKLPRRAGLKLSVVDEETLVEVPFKFENAPLPPRR